jgi:hypothetical protein
VLSSQPHSLLNFTIRNTTKAILQTLVSIFHSIIALLSEYSVYIPIFGLLFYWDNTHRYINPLTGKKDFKVIKTDIKKLLTALSISEVAYSLSKISITYQFLQFGVMPYQASMFGALAASAVSIVLINLLVIRVVKLFKTAGRVTPTPQIN